MAVASRPALGLLPSALAVQVLCEVKVGLLAGPRDLASSALHLSLHSTNTAWPRDTPEGQWSDPCKESKQNEDREATSHQAPGQTTGVLRTGELDPFHLARH